MGTPNGNRAMQETFRQAARTYELVNHALTWQLDIAWRRWAARHAVVGGGDRWLDICTGTGDMAVALRCRAPAGTQVVAVDLTPEMLHRAAARRDVVGVDFALADVRSLPFADETFDLATISFATRNVNHNRDALTAVFREVWRVLKPGGRFVGVETSQPPHRLVRWLFHTYVRLVVRPVGQLLSGSRAAYAYLAYTIPRFYSAEELSGLLRESGFGEVTVRTETLGVVAAHIARKECVS